VAGRDDGRDVQLKGGAGGAKVLEAGVGITQRAVVGVAFCLGLLAVFASQVLVFSLKNFKL
jgi:hypothetical protein